MPAPHSSSETPLMRQYLEIKAQHPDAILMFRMGDFYEMFFEDAVTVGPVLDIVVTTRDRNAEDPVPMAGVPYHAVGGYLRTLVERGFKVAVCEQMESPDEVKRRKGPTLMRREVVRIVTPGVRLDEEHLEGDQPNFLAAYVPTRDKGTRAALAALDVSSGEFVVIGLREETLVRSELLRLSPAEVLTPGRSTDTLREMLGGKGPRIERREPEDVLPDVRKRVRALRQETGGAPLAPELEDAAALVLAYAEATQPGQTLLLHRLREHDPAAHVVLDETTLRNLELFRTLRDGRKDGTLLSVVDETRTAMGARLLRGWLGAPSVDRQVIAARHDAVEALLVDRKLREELRSSLKDVRDVVRLAARARLSTATPRELGALRDSLEAIPRIAASLASRARRVATIPAGDLLDLGADLVQDLAATLRAYLVDKPPAIARDGGMIRDGADRRLDEQRRLRDGGKEALAQIEARERETTKIGSLKVLHNRVFGYYIEVPRAQSAKVPDRFVRKQTVANAERYVTEELAAHETAVLSAQSEALAREQELFADLRRVSSEAAERLVELGDRLARLDVVAGLAEVADRFDYVRPTMVDTSVLELREARHPVVERMLPRGAFVPNDVGLSADAEATDPRFWLLTGPNMGGKSTVMRQAGLLTILAHAGSFVPAQAATVGIVDRVFTRVGAADDLGRGESTFMVEMRETAQILTQATSRSLVLLDEIGRGTATFDGVALAWSIAEFVHDRLRCRAIFATHYHELCGLETTLQGLANVHVEVHEQGGHVSFLHRVRPGPAGRSYGIAVGKLAGLPPQVLRRAERILRRLEATDRVHGSPQLDLFVPRGGGGASFDGAPGPLTAGEPRTLADGRSEASDDSASGRATAHARARFVAEVLRTDPDDLTPRQAHELVRRWVQDLAEISAASEQRAPVGTAGASASAYES